MTDSLNAVSSNDRAVLTDTNPKNLELALPQSATATRLDQLVYSTNYYIQIFRLDLLPAVRIEPSTTRSKLKSNALWELYVFKPILQHTYGFIVNNLINLLCVMLYIT